ncbi:hypothetical protein BC937DRAFT_90790 [Endogone sp. FLAS-F59071]|nr:hypothetical protein BC937DRAFT_90790 [Endogone sp. FLAS-F59071]|eukprot:RUS23206.1 hypothetical protein BC937DRAFT_90790 [Endogone sp. FLAS-F59071]
MGNSAPNAHGNLFLQIYPIYMSQNDDDDPANAGFTLRHDPTIATASSDDSAVMERRLRLHRIVPLVAGVLVPFSIILNIPALTGPWLVVGGEEKDIGMEESSGHVTLLVITLVFAVTVNIALVFRFVNWQARWATRVALISAALQLKFPVIESDTIVIVILVVFSVQHHLTANSYYGEGYWTILASSVFCLTATMLLTFDCINTPYIKCSGFAINGIRTVILEDIESTYISQVERLRRQHRKRKRRRYEHHMLHRDDPRHHRFHLHLHHPHDHCHKHCPECLNGNAGGDTPPLSDRSPSLTPEQELLEDQKVARREEALEYRRKTTFATLAFGLFWCIYLFSFIHL